MKVKDPAKTADEIVDTYNSRDPERIAKLCGILIKEVDWDKQSGAYTEILRQPVIFISKNLRRSMRSVVIAHELGHHFLHRKEAAEVGGFKEFEVFNMTKSNLEYEANIFAAQLLLPDDAVKEMVYNGFDSQKIAQATGSIINARVETAHEKATFRDSWEKRRCAIPASYYFEWEHLKTDSGKKKTGEKFMIQLEGSSIVFFAGLYRVEVIKGVKVPVFTILTTEAAEEIRFIHDRMPVMLAKDDAEKWVRAESNVCDFPRVALIYERSAH